MRVKLAVWTVSVLLAGMAWPASASSTLANGPISGSSGCVDDTWAATSQGGAPSARGGHTAVWTGTEMIVWGGSDGTSRLNTGGRYNPLTDTWATISTINAPLARDLHTAVWAGSKMIVWGGARDGTSIALNTGGRYDPASDTWTATSTVNAPSGRAAHTAVWTGTQMIVWGGNDNFDPLNSGGRYDPVTDTWAAISTVNAPSPRWFHTAVWTGAEMIVWGGRTPSSLLNTGGRYNPATDTWAAISTVNAADARLYHTAVWTGAEMIVWGGEDLTCSINTGGRYDPATDTWAATRTDGAPSARYSHTAVWTGTQMIVWGGLGCFSLSNTGGRYDPATDTWMATRADGAPSPRGIHTAVWTSTQMIVWGGQAGGSPPLNTGGRYCASSGASQVGLTCAPRLLGAPVEGTATLTIRASAAPKTDLTVNLVSNNPNVAQIPPTVTIPAGQTSATATVNGVMRGSTFITARAADGQARCSVYVGPRFSGDVSGLATTPLRILIGGPDPVITVPVRVWIDPLVVTQPVKVSIEP